MSNNANLNLKKDELEELSSILLKHRFFLIDEKYKDGNEDVYNIINNKSVLCENILDKVIGVLKLIE